MRRPRAVGVVVAMVLASAATLVAAPDAHAEVGAGAAIIDVDEPADAWLHETCSYRGLHELDAVGAALLAPAGTVAVRIVRLDRASGTTRANVKIFRCATKPPFSAQAFTPAPFAAVACIEAKLATTCVPPLAPSTARVPLLPPSPDRSAPVVPSPAAVVPRGVFALAAAAVEIVASAWRAALRIEDPRS